MDKKIIITIAIATIAIICGGIFLTSRQSSQPQKVNTDLLIRSDSQRIKAAKEEATLVEFGDFQCPACGAYYPLVKRLTSDFKDNLTLVFRNFPLVQHKNARPAAYAAEAAGNQGKYWEMFDLLYVNQDKWSKLDNPKDVFDGYAKILSLDLNKFDADMAGDSINQKIQRDLADGNTLGVDSTPTFYLNGEKIANPTSYENFQTLVKAAILKQQANVSTEEKYHTHFDLKVYLNGVAVNFSLAKYQSSKDNEFSPDIHFHDGNGKVVHIHKKGATLGELFNSFKLDLTKYQNLKTYVNGKETSDVQNYVPQDLDRILITSGNLTETQLKVQLDSVSNDACIYSEKCPERGKPPTEECVGGLGSGCD